MGIDRENQVRQFDPKTVFGERKAARAGCAEIQARIALLKSWYASSPPP